MIIGKENSVNNKLVEKISKVFPIQFVDYENLLEGGLTETIPKVILINLMDLGVNEARLLTFLNENYPNSKRIAMHCFQLENMIQGTLAKGYDEYISIFDVSENIIPTLERLSA